MNLAELWSMRHSRCIRFAHSGTLWVAELRGLRAFEKFRAASRFRRLVGGHGKVHISSRITSPPCPDELLFILMPATPAIANHIERRRSSRLLTTVVVDVHADVLGLEVGGPSAEMVKAARDGSEPGAWEWWADPVRLESLTRAIRAADVVTTPWRQLVEPLRKLNPRVVHLPDAVPGKTAVFAANFRAAVVDR